MKKALFAISLFLSLIIVTACTKGDPNYTGNVVARGSGPEMIVIEHEEKEYGFIITDETTLKMSDEMLESIGYIDGEDLFDYLSLYMNVDVLAGKEASPSENYISDDLCAWYYANRITVNEIYDEYFLADGE